MSTRIQWAWDKLLLRRFYARGTQLIYVSGGKNARFSDLGQLFGDPQCVGTSLDDVMIIRRAKRACMVGVYFPVAGFSTGFFSAKRIFSPVARFSAGFVTTFSVPVKPDTTSASAPSSRPRVTFFSSKVLSSRMI